MREQPTECSEAWSAPVLSRTPAQAVTVSWCRSVTKPTESIQCDSQLESWTAISLQSKRENSAWLESYHRTQYRQQTLSRRPRGQQPPKGVATAVPADLASFRPGFLPSLEFKLNYLEHRFPLWSFPFGLPAKSDLHVSQSSPGERFAASQTIGLVRDPKQYCTILFSLLRSQPEPSLLDCFSVLLHNIPVYSPSTSP